MNEIVIIGNGISGITAARHIRKYSDFRVTVISAESKYFWSRTALMYIYMGHMKYHHTKPYEDSFWKKNNIDLIYGRVSHIDTAKKSLSIDNGDTVSFDKLILATGSRHNIFDWKGKDLEGISGMISLQDLERIEKFTTGIKQAAIVGGGLIGIELAEMLRSRDIDVTLIVRESHFWGNVLPEMEASMIDNHILEHGIDLKLNTEVKEFLSDAQGRVRAVITTNGEEIPCQFAGLTAGVHPNIDLVRDTDIESDRGILVDDYLTTSIRDIYAVGDCAQLRAPLPGRRAIEPVWYTGRMMGEVVAQNVIGNKTPYRPGPWFNSAKFLDIEYQTYGEVSPDCPDDQHEIYWQHDSGMHAVHIRFDKNSNLLRGLNVFGVRMRHDQIDLWLRNGISITSFLNSMEKADFNPEFSDDHWNDIREQFNNQFPDMAVKLVKKRRKVFGLI